MKKHRLERVKLKGEMAVRFRKLYRHRISGLIDIHLHDVRVEQLPTLIESFGQDVYLQGILDGIQVAQNNPDFVKELMNDTQEAATPRSAEVDWEGSG
jgi:hypothetical protein